MADDTFADRGIGSVLASTGNFKRKSAVVAAGETIKPGYAIYIAAGKMYAAKAADAKWSGVAVERPGDELDTAYTVGELVPYYPRQQDIECWMYMVKQTPSATAFDEGMKACLSTTDGMISKFSYAGASADFTDMVGVFRQYGAGSTSANKLVKVHIAA